MSTLAQFPRRAPPGFKLESEESAVIQKQYYLLISVTPVVVVALLPQFESSVVLEFYSYEMCYIVIISSRVMNTRYINITKANYYVTYRFSIQRALVEIVF